MGTWKTIPTPGPDPIKLFLASIYATLKSHPIRSAMQPSKASLIGPKFCVASIEAEKSLIGLGPGANLIKNFRSREGTIPLRIDQSVGLKSHVTPTKLI